MKRIMALLELLRNFQWQRWFSFLVLACAVLANRKLEDIPGNTRQFISKINHNCRDFKGVLSRCHVWKDMGFCFKYRRQMQHVCNRTCQYCIPGQKQWQVIDIKGVWGEVRKPGIAHGMSSAAQPKAKASAVQILGKERAPQVDDAASAIATQLEDGIDGGISASPKVLNQLNKFHIGLPNALAPTETNTTTSDEAKGKMSTSQPVSPTNQGEHKPHPTDGPSISGITQVSAQNKEGHPFVILMGYELGQKSSQKVNDVLKNTDSFQRIDLGATNNVGPQGGFTNNTLLALRENSVPHVKAAQERNATGRIPSEENVPESDLQEISTLLDNAASSNNNQYMHEETNERNADTNALQLKTGAPSLDTQATNALQSNVTHDEGTGNPDPILPVSSDDTVNRQTFDQLTMHAQQDTPVINTSSMADTVLKPHSVEGMPSDISGMLNKHGNINNPILQMNRPPPKHAFPGPSGKQVTLTINEKPGTGEAVFEVQNSPHATGLSYETEGNSGNLLPSSYDLQWESEEARAKSDEEETKIREATNAIKNVIKLFGKDNRRGRTRLIQQATQDFRGDSKSLEAGRKLSEYEAQVAQAQNQDRAIASAQALSQQSGQEFNRNELEPGLHSLRQPNYAVVSTSDSKEWKNLAHVLATQLKRVLNHMEDREMENRYEKEKVQEEMMLMAQQQMMGRDEDEGPDNENENDEDDDDDDEMNNREKRRHSVLSPYVKQRSVNSRKKAKVTDKKFQTNSSGKLTDPNLVHRAVKTLSRLEKFHKSKKHKRRLVK